jgi:phosphoribosyl-ATP pyrophosphohydrolase
VRLLDEPDLLAAKLTEELGELLHPDANVAAEAADLLYLTLVKSISAGVSLEDVVSVLDRRERLVSRRPMVAKEVE